MLVLWEYPFEILEIKTSQPPVYQYRLFELNIDLS